MYCSGIASIAASVIYAYAYRLFLSRESLFEISKELQLLVLLILHDLRVSVVRKDSCPSQKGFVAISHLLQINFTLCSTVFHGRRRRADFVSNSVVAVL